MTEPTRVLLVAAATSTAGGGEKHVADLMRRLPGGGVEVGLACPLGGELGALAEQLAITWFPAEIASGFSAGRVRRLRQAIREFRPHVVHAHGSRAAMFARLADRQSSDRVVYTVHGIHIDKAGSPVRRSVLLGVERFLKPKTAAWVTVCRADTRKGALLGTLLEGRARTIYNGIEMPAEKDASGAFREELGLSEDIPLAVCIGRFHEQKDHATLLSAFAEVRRRLPSARLALVGSGELEAALREKAVALRIAEAVAFLPPRQDLGDVYRDADVIALSSLWEGLPYVVLEGMAYRKPVVATAVDGVPEAVEEGESGLLVPPADPAALADALVALLSDPARAQRMGEAGRGRVERDFTLERMTREYLDLYAGLRAEQETPRA